MKNYIVLLMLILLLPLVGATSLYQVSGAFGTNQYYSVSFDGEGEASVAAKLSFQNLQQTDINSLTLEMPGRNVRIVTILQEYPKTEKVCNNWQDTCTTTNRDGLCLQYERTCSIWVDQESWEKNYAIANYSKESLSNSAKVNINLPKVLKSQSSATLIIYYKATGYADKSLGNFNFNFETVKVAYDVNNVRVAVNVAGDLYLDGGQSSINYQANYGFNALAKASESMDTASPEIRQFSDSITYQGGYVKQASGLDPWESFSVKGTYSDSWLMLHKLGILIWLVVIAAAVFGIIKFVKSRPAPVKKVAQDQGFMVSTIWISLVTAVAIMAGWFLALFLFDRIGYVGGSAEYLIPLIVLMLILLFIAAFFGPSVYIGIRYGAKNGLINFGLTVAWLVVLSVILIVILSSFNPRVYY